MKIEEIKKDILQKSINNGLGYAYNLGGQNAIDTYYTPLAESHRELFRLLTIPQDKIQFNKWVELKEIAINNAKKLINE